MIKIASLCLSITFCQHISKGFSIQTAYFYSFLFYFISAVFGNSARKQAKHPSEHDQKSANTAKSFKILQRTETDGRPDQARRYSPVNARRSSPSSMTSSGNQELYPNSTRSLSPSSNSAFTRVSRVNNTRRARPKNKQQAKSPTTSIDMTFTAPAWTNFKFDKVKILEAFRA